MVGMADRQVRKVSKANRQVEDRRREDAGNGGSGAPKLPARSVGVSPQRRFARMLTDIQSFESTVGYRFKNRNLLLQALTHRSHSQESGNGGGDNERFEFLGDAILGFLACERLVAKFPREPEGQLSKWKARLVSAVNLLEVARAIGLGTYLQLGRGEERTGGRDKSTILADALEALIAALYLDGGMKAAEGFVDRLILTDQALDAAARGDSPQDFKSPLQELLQGARLPTPLYNRVEEQGPPHARTFRVEVRIGEMFRAEGQGTSKKSAEQKAAQLALEYFQANPPAPAIPVRKPPNGNGGAGRAVL